MEGEGEMTGVGAKCGRWNPTAEQVKVLTDLFRSGLRTPSTDQIQTISTHLSAFGKIESKNVFYWFQNHKARERHHKKRRRPPPPDDGVASSDHHKVTKSRCYFPGADWTKAKQNSDLWRKHEMAGGGTKETLELFPLQSCSFEDERKRKATGSVRSELCGRGRVLFSDAGRRDPPLDLRLSFT